MDPRWQPFISAPYASSQIGPYVPSAHLGMNPYQHPHLPAPQVGGPHFYEGFNEACNIYYHPNEGAQQSQILPSNWLGEAVRTVDPGAYYDDNGTDGQKMSGTFFVPREIADKPKASMRNLPPTMREDEFEAAFKIPLYALKFRFVKGCNYSKRYRFSRAYFAFSDHESRARFFTEYDDTVIKDYKGRDFKARMAIAKGDSDSEDEDETDFDQRLMRLAMRREHKAMQLLENPPPTLTPDDFLAEIEQKEALRRANGGILPQRTPLIKYVEKLRKLKGPPAGDGELVPASLEHKVIPKNRDGASAADVPAASKVVPENVWSTLRSSSSRGSFEGGKISDVSKSRQTESSVVAPAVQSATGRAALVGTIRTQQQPQQSRYFGPRYLTPFFVLMLDQSTQTQEGTKKSLVQVPVAKTSQAKDGLPSSAMSPAVAATNANDKSRWAHLPWNQPKKSKKLKEPPAVDNDAEKPDKAQAVSVLDLTALSHRKPTSRFTKPFPSSITETGPNELRLLKPVPGVRQPYRAVLLRKRPRKKTSIQCQTDF